MVFTSGEILLFGFGLIPQYVSVFVVEKYYTNFWTGFWNIFGLIEVVASLILASDSGRMVVIGSALLVGLMFLLYLAVLGGYENIARRFGASLISTSVCWGLFVWFYTGSVWKGLLVGDAHVLIFILLGIISEH